MTAQWFRRLIIIWWILSVFCVVVTIITQSYLPAELIAYLDSVANAEPTVIGWVTLALAIILFALSIVASVGLFRLKKWGRGIFLWVQIVCIALTPFFGVSIISEWAAIICYVYVLLTGGILFSMHLPPIRDILEHTGDG